MTMYRCKVCDSEYTDVLPDGMRYYHVCAPITNPLYEAQFHVDENGNLVPNGPLDPRIRPTIERPLARNENVEKKPDGSTGPKKDPPGKDPVV